MLIKDIDIRKFALLLDVDGTLLDIAPTPLAVEVPDRLRRALAALAEQTGGATAFVSGRPLTQLDQLFAPLKLPAVGGHGAELRVNGSDQPQRFDLGLSDDLRGQFKAFASKLDGVILEDKGFSIALHYQLVPQHAEIVREAVAAACAPCPDGSIEVLLGKAVIEVKPAAFHKGTGIRDIDGDTRRSAGGGRSSSATISPTMPRSRCCRTSTASDFPSDGRSRGWRAACRQTE